MFTSVKWFEVPVRAGRVQMVVSSLMKITAKSPATIQRPSDTFTAFKPPCVAPSAAAATVLSLIHI